MNIILELLPSLWKRKLFLLLALDFGVGKHLLKHTSEECRNDREVVLKAIAYSYEEFQFASYQLRNDREFILKAIEISEISLLFASDEVLGDRDFILRVVLEHPDSISHVDLMWQNDREIMLALVKHNAKRYFPCEYFAKDREFALIAVKQWGKALGYLPSKLQKDKVLLREAVKQLAPHLIDFSKDELDITEEGLVLEYAREYIGLEELEDYEFFFMSQAT